MAANTYNAIQTITVGSGGAATIDFQNIPATYTDLCLLVSARGSTTTASGGHYYTIKINNSSSNLTQRWLQLQASNVVASGSSSTSTLNYMPPSEFTASTFSNNRSYFPNYTSSDNKSWMTDCTTENNATDSYMGIVGLLWSQTTAIDRITLTPGGGNFAQYSTATLYGISKS